jgi:HlyD family secretion protein
MNPNFLQKHHIVSGAAIAVIIAAAIFTSLKLKQQPTYNFIGVTRQTITRGANETGTVKAAQDLSLTFQKSGYIAQVPVKAGDLVKKGQLLLAMDNKDSSASISQANASVAMAQANLDKVLNGATSADVAVAQTALDNAKKNLDETTKQQDLLVSNALAAYLNTVNPTGMSNGLSAMPAVGNVGTAVITLSGSYKSFTQGQYILTAYVTGSGIKLNVSGLETAGVDARTSPVALGTNGLFIQVSGQPANGDNWTISIPNTQSPSYVSDYNAYNAALETRTQAILGASNAVDTAQSQLALKQTPARPEDIAAARAQLATAQAALQAAQNSYSNGVLISPIDGVITAVNGKIGELASPGKPAISLISNQKFQIETYVSQGDLGKIKTGDKANVFLDAYGNGVNFDASVIGIDPAATMSGNISGYKVTLEFNREDDRIKEGLNANINISDDSHENALAIPSGDIITKNNQKFVLKDIGNGKTSQVEVQTGLTGLDGMVEITGGLNENDRVVNLGN